MFSNRSLVKNSTWAVLIMSIATAQPALSLPAGSGLIAAGSKSDDDSDNSFSGNISWYGPGFHGKRTASGEIFDMNKHTAAHRKLRFRTKVLVENPRNGKSCVVSVNDRGPYVYSRVMDVSKGTARSLGSLSAGVIYADCLILDDN